jgi:hypothetical protein
MIEYNQAEQSEFSDTSEFGVKVIGIGGAGANVLDRMALEGSDDAELLTLNTDVRALSTSVSSHKVQLGATLLKGMGTGGDPTLGKQAAIEAVDEIRKALDLAGEPDPVPPRKSAGSRKRKGFFSPSLRRCRSPSRVSDAWTRPRWLSIRSRVTPMP